MEVIEKPEDYDRTLRFGETALGHLKANEMPAYPRNYELWYTYVSGLNPALNRAINDLLKSQGRLSLNETDRIYDEHLSPTRFSDKMEEIGGKLNMQLDVMLGALDNASSETAAYGQTLAQASNAMTDSASDKEALLATVQKLAQETRRMEQRNIELEKNLGSARDKVAELQANLETVKHESLTDPLTALANRKLFDQSMMRVIEAAEENGKTFSLLISDVDFFKKFNDTYGHQTGDQVLRLVASVMKQSIKGMDIAARYGGEEFAVILPQTPIDLAVVVANNIREAVMNKELIKRSTNERLGRVTVSIGVATFRKGDTPAAMIERADAALYQAKRNGRNCVVKESDVTNTSAVA